jgi:tocopherol cyclase
MFTQVMHPEGYHGRSWYRGFFEGWYLKLVDAKGQYKLAVIPGISQDQDREQAHCFIQILDGHRGSATYHRFPLDAFVALRDTFDVRIGPNHFGSTGMTLDLDDLGSRIVGQVAFRGVHPWPVTPLNPGAMGPFAYLPWMECYHGVMSFDHALDGTLLVDGEPMVWDGGRGYIEKDWGRSFPKAWIWMQSNHFDSPGTSLMASVAIIPWLGSTFRGFMVGLWHHGRLLRWATYTGARIERLEVQDEVISLQLLGRFGSTRGLRLELVARRATSAPLLGPRRGAMSERVPETLDAVIALRLTQASDPRETLYQDKGLHGGLEAVGELARLQT